MLEMSVCDGECGLRFREDGSGLMKQNPLAVHYGPLEQIDRSGCLRETRLTLAGAVGARPVCL